MKKLALLIFFLQIGLVCGAEGFYVSEITAFVSPDSSYSALVDFIDNAKASLYVNVYTFDSPLIAERIVNAKTKGVDVIIMVDKSPVAGISGEEKVVISYLLSNGVQVYYSDDRRVTYNHAKYAIADNVSILITTENFGYSGFSADSSFGARGWGAVMHDVPLTRYFVNIFFKDLKYVEKASPLPAAAAHTNLKGKYSPVFAAENFKGNFFVVPVVGPENAVEKIVALLNSANKSLYIEQFYIYEHWGSIKKDTPETAPNLFLEAAINAARRGVEVKILLDSTWYNIEAEDPASNYNTLKYVQNIAKKESLNLQVKLANSKKLGLEKIHTKGVVVDKKAVLISSINWNEHSPTKNREVGVIVHGEPAMYFVEVFECDWSGTCGSREYVYIVAIGILILAIYARHKYSNVYTH